ncbi:hypothetical protein RchiOBHm_Chr4g0423021 [Rosa chinensis]|uniref:Uncharacterized protein n=1 Tax=Rosa chinensis TaxID=74649 RepID=A0A2P6QYH5_ROSCH|nr:hypothetical protein RchiOBHm_Chr4g0423021 [Rosa chinensis]
MFVLGWEIDLFNEVLDLVIYFLTLTCVSSFCVFRFEREVQLMKNLLEGYRKALKATQKTFAEHTAHCPQAVEPFCRDRCFGIGGLVLSTTELEKLRLKQEEEERMNKTGD